MSPSSFEISEKASIEIQTYAGILKGNGVVAFPTETVYGLGASVWSPQAVKKVFDLKGRPSDNPLIVHISSYGMLLSLVADIPFQSRILMQKFWPGPLTLIFEKKQTVLDIVTGGLDSVAVRMPDHIYALKLIDLAGPLVAPSANKSGRPSPTSANHVLQDFGNQVMVMDGGQCNIGLESTVLDVRKEPFTILRPGKITAAMIYERTGLTVTETTNSDVLRPVSPGTKYSHYAPEANVRWISDDEMSRSQFQEYTLYLSLSKKFDALDRLFSRNIFFDNDLDRMARELYDWFRKADLDGYRDIAIEKPLSQGKEDISAALINRIEKAIKR